MLEITGAAKGGSHRSGAVYINIEGARELPLRTSLRRGIAYALQYAFGNSEVYYKHAPPTLVPTRGGSRIPIYGRPWSTPWRPEGSPASRSPSSSKRPCS